MSQAPQTQDATAAPAGDGEELLAFPASIAQQVFWYLELLQPGVTAFNSRCASASKGRSTFAC